MKQFQKFITHKNSFTHLNRTFRQVNQREIFEWIKLIPGMTEGMIMEEVYGYVRGSSYESNKRYADCLRRLLATGKIYRKEYKKGRYKYYTNLEKWVDGKLEVTTTNKVNTDTHTTYKGEVIGVNFGGSDFMMLTKAMIAEKLGLDVNKFIIVN